MLPFHQHAPVFNQGNVWINLAVGNGHVLDARTIGLANQDSGELVYEFVFPNQVILGKKDTIVGFRSVIQALVQLDVGSRPSRINPVGVSVNGPVSLRSGFHDFHEFQVSIDVVFVL